MPIFETWPSFLSQLDTKLLKTVFTYRQLHNSIMYSLSDRHVIDSDKKIVTN